ncbi:hypothetical protein HYQ46_004401 [Verticillium longisporum]|nr:hypothetical protein HYQ46_004401 [Verticillium longisporum]
MKSSDMRWTDVVTISSPREGKVKHTKETQEDRQKSSWMGRLGGERAVSCEREAGVVLLFLDSGRPRNPPEYSEAAFSKI